MNEFMDYSNYYDLIYKDKDYNSESEYVSSLIRARNPEAGTILDLGCGTGRHDAFLSKKGYIVQGIDKSPGMINIAKSYSNENLTFCEGDIRTINLNKKFDCVTSLFHVLSYQTGNDDLKRTFSTACRHLNKDGIFIFDCWYGPAVLSEKPSVRSKRIETENLVITRIAVPEIHSESNTVDVKYTILIFDKTKGTAEEIHETHSMRYLFLPEIEELFNISNMKILFSYQWMTQKEPDIDTWSICCGGKI